MSTTLLTHFSAIEHPSLDMIQERLFHIRQTLTDRKSLALLDQLTEFPLGRFLILNNGALSGYWTYYIIAGHNIEPIKHPLERKLLQACSITTAMRDRFSQCRTVLKEILQSEMTLASIPCGTMQDLLHEDWPETLSNVHFVGIDLDDAAFHHAKTSQSKGIFSSKFEKHDAWHLPHESTFDGILSNGLNFYEPDDDRVIALYRQFHRALIPGGFLLTSALTAPPTATTECEWNMAAIDQASLALEAAVFNVLKARWANFRSSTKTIEQLKAAGFHKVDVFWDPQKRFPSFLAK